jgi:hypothetical protein
MQIQPKPIPFAQTEFRMCTNALVTPIKKSLHLHEDGQKLDPLEQLELCLRYRSNVSVVHLLCVCIGHRNRAEIASYSRSTLTLPVPLNRCCNVDDRHSHLVHAYTQVVKERSIGRQEASLVDSKMAASV